MNKSEIKDEQFPMFELNWFERRAIKKARRRFRDSQVLSAYLCITLSDYLFTGGLLKKIDKTLDPYVSLDDYMGVRIGAQFQELLELRIRWIDLLLMHNQ